MFSGNLYWFFSEPMNPKLFTLFSPPTAIGFFLGMAGFILKHPGFLPTRPTSFLPADLLLFLPFARLFALALLQDQLGKGASGEPSVLFSEAALLHLYRQHTGALKQSHRTGGFVYLLSARSGAQDKLLLQVLFPKSCPLHQRLNRFNCSRRKCHFLHLRMERVQLKSR